MKKSDKERAVALRREGKSYSEILREVAVAKSTLSLWFQRVALSNKQKQRLTQKKIDAAFRGAQKRRMQRLERVSNIQQQAKTEVARRLPTIQEVDIWLMGIMLYWAEGSKEKDYRIGQGVIFSNSDPYMIKLFLHWVRSELNIPKHRIVFEIYIHENRRSDASTIKHYWSQTCETDITVFNKVYYKKNKLLTQRKRTGDTYYGQLRIRITKSTDLNRKISAWVTEICHICGVV